jgi:hypothetical protein
MADPFGIVGVISLTIQITQTIAQSGFGKNVSARRYELGRLLRRRTREKTPVEKNG